jgi:hypothetical protein
MPWPLGHDISFAIHIWLQRLRLLGVIRVSKPSYYYDTIRVIHNVTSVIRVNRVSLIPIMTLLWHYYDTIMTLLWHYYNVHYDTGNYYDTIMTLLWQYYDNFMTILSHYYHDNIITLLPPYYCTIMTLLWHHYNHYDRVSAPSLSECAYSSLLSEHGEMIINLPKCLEFDFNQQIGAQLSWEAASVTCQILLYTLFVPLYSFWQLSNQYCSSSKKVLRTADMQVVSLGVTSSWGSTNQAVVDARRVDTVQGCDYYLSYDTIISLMTFIIDIITK